MIRQDIRSAISSSLCSRCGGEAPGWKCARCSKTFAAFDPLHWRVCRFGGKCQAQCKKCGEAEEKCACSRVS